MTRHKLLVAAALALVAVAAAPAARAESPRHMMLEIHFGTYAPEVDDGFSDATPWADTFGSDSIFLFRLHLDYQLWQGHGALGIGGGWGYGWLDGNALEGDGTKSADETGFNFMPLTASLVYRWDWAAIRHSVPLVPYVKVGLTAAFWWATNAKDEISNTRGPDGEARTGNGLTFGWHVGGGIQFLLDILSPSMAQEFDNESGVNSSYLFAEILYQDISDFGSDESINLSDTAFSFGLMFEF